MRLLCLYSFRTSIFTSAHTCTYCFHLGPLSFPPIRTVQRKEPSKTTQPNCLTSPASLLTRMCLSHLHIYKTQEGAICYRLCSQFLFFFSWLNYLFFSDTSQKQHRANIKLTVITRQFLRWNKNRNNCFWHLYLLTPLLGGTFFFPEEKKASLQS